MNWTDQSQAAVQDPDTGYITPGSPGQSKSVPCRFHLGGIKEFMNEDNSVVNQVGRIRIDVNSDIPSIGQIVEVEGHFYGPIRDIYKGQLSWRLDV